MPVTKMKGTAAIAFNGQKKSQAHLRKHRAKDSSNAPVPRRLRKH